MTTTVPQVYRLGALHWEPAESQAVVVPFTGQSDFAVVLAEFIWSLLPEADSLFVQTSEQGWRAEAITSEPGTGLLWTARGWRFVEDGN